MSIFETVDWKTILPVFTLAAGWIVGVFNKTVQEWVHSLFYRPKLSVAYIVPSRDSAGRKLETVRVKVRNHGNVTAKNVRVQITGIILQTVEERNAVFDTDVLDLTFSD